MQMDRDSEVNQETVSNLNFYLTRGKGERLKLTKLVRKPTNKSKSIFLPFSQKEEAEEIEGVIVDPSNFESSAEKLAMAAIKYFDLK
jgi:hypothetical protein